MFKTVCVVPVRTYVDPAHQKCHTFKPLPLKLASSSFVQNRTFLTMQQIQVLEMIPGSYRYGNRSDRTPLHKDFVNLVMEQQFTTVWRMHQEEQARVTRLQQTTDEFLDEYKKKHILRKMRITIDKHMKKVREGTEALVWNVNDAGNMMSSTSDATEESDLKHPQMCACLVCERRKDECISMQEAYLMDAGQDPDSQLADDHLSHLMGKAIWNNTALAQQLPIPIVHYTPVAMQAETPRPMHSNTPTAFFVPETPGTGATVFVFSPIQEATRDMPITSSELLEVYVEGIQGDNEDDAETNAAKRARIMPTKLDFP